jgi:hypothetical protein
MNKAQAQPNRSWTAALREAIRVYFVVSLAAYALSLLVLACCPAGFPSARDSLVAMPMLYILLWSGAFCPILAYGHTLASGIGFLVVVVALCAVPFTVRSDIGRTLLLYISAATWFVASFSVFLSALL